MRAEHAAAVGVDVAEVALEPRARRAGRSADDALGAEPGAEYPTAVGLGPGAATARLERRLHLDAVDRADLAVRAYLCGVGRVDLGAELELDRGAAAP